MPFLILTRPGFDDIVPRVTLAGAQFELNPGIATDDELVRLRAAGAHVQVLDEPAPLPEIDNAAGAITWVEQGRAYQSATRRAPPSAAQGAAHQWLHRRFARNAGVFASAALRSWRQRAPGQHLMVVPYIGFGNGNKVWVQGRVLDEDAYREQSHTDSPWSNLVALYRRLESDEVAGATVRASFMGLQQETVTDDGGYFAFELATPKELDGGMHGVEIELPESLGSDGTPARVTAEVIVPGPAARFGVISDIDDTVLWTNVTNKLNMALMLARSNAHTRKPFKGVAAFYQALCKGVGGDEGNPIFYVSSSPWHLFGPLVEFLRVQKIPVGPLLLRKLGLREVFKLKHHHHKLEKIELIMRFYPDLQFVLIGDSGEQDPEIYAEVLKRHPKSVRVIYIRNVNPDPSRIDALDKLIEEVSATGTQLILAPDSVFAAAHAAAEGLIQLQNMSSVRLEKKVDEGIADPTAPAPMGT